MACGHIELDAPPAHAATQPTFFLGPSPTALVLLPPQSQSQSQSQSHSQSKSHSPFALRSPTTAAADALQTRAARLPKHVAIIPDGNGRWGRQQGKSRNEGHARGAEGLQKCIQCCAESGVKYVTVYAMSAENFSRPTEEVDFLMSLFARFIRTMAGEAKARGLRLQFIGDRAIIPNTLIATMDSAQSLTQHGTTLTVILALAYGARQEIAGVARALAAAAVAGRIQVGDIDDFAFEAQLAADQGSIPPPDLLIRTGGEKRLSNFLLWQVAYTELYFCDQLWPDFDADSLADALAWYQTRQRRFGKLPLDTAG